MRRALIVPFMLIVLAVSCTAQQRRSISEAVVRNVVSFEAAKEFKNHGFPIHDHLVCKAKASRSDESHVGVICSGTTTKGQQVMVIGTTNNIRGNQGHFVGSVDGATVFDEKCLGC